MITTIYAKDGNPAEGYSVILWNSMGINHDSQRVLNNCN